MSLQFAPTSTSKTQAVNWKAVVFWGILLGLISFAVWHFYKEPILSFVQNPTFDLSILQNLTLDNILVFLQKYGVLFSMIGVGVTFIYGFYQKIRANKAATQLLQTQIQGQTELNQAYTVAEQYKTQAETYKLQYEQASKNDLGETLAEAQNLVTQKNSEMERMKIEYQTAVKTLQNEIDRLKIQIKEVIVVK